MILWVMPFAGKGIKFYASSLHPAYMGHKIATIILSHDCDEDPCHLNNDEQGRWIRSTLPMEKLGWNWNLKTIKVYSVSREAEDAGTSDYIAKVVQTGGDER